LWLKISVLAANGRLEDGADQLVDDYIDDDEDMTVIMGRD
jgi:hypothetical protein